MEFRVLSRCDERIGATNPFRSPLLERLGTPFASPFTESFRRWFMSKTVAKGISFSILVGYFLVGEASHAGAATIAAPSCAPTDVQAAVDSARAGDVVSLPYGTRVCGNLSGARSNP